MARLIQIFGKIDAAQYLELGKKISVIKEIKRRIGEEMTMFPWPRYPSIYEINTWVWLQELGRKHSTPLSLKRLAGALL